MKKWQELALSSSSSWFTSGKLPVINVFHCLSNEVSVDYSKDFIIHLEWLDTLSCSFVIDSVDFISLMF